MVQATRWREGRARDMKGPLSPPWIIPRIAHSFSLFLGHRYILFFKRQQSYHCNLPIADKYFLNVLIRISCCHRANYFLPPPSYPKTFCLKTKCFWAKLLIFSLFIGFMAEGGFYGRALTQRPKSITFLQHPHSGTDTSPFWQNHQKYMFFAKCFCNTITLARILPHFEKIIMICPDKYKNQKRERRIWELI